MDTSKKMSTQTDTVENDKRKRRDQNTSSDTSLLSPKRIKASELSADSENSLFIQDSMVETPTKSGQEPPLSFSEGSPPLTSTPADHTGTMDTLDQQSLDKLITSMENMLDTKLATLRKDMIDEMKATLTREISVIKLQYDQELDEMKGRVHTLEVENESLRQKVTKLWEERQTTQDNINSAKIQSVENAQYVRRTNIIMYGVKEGRDDEEDPGVVVRGLIKDKLKYNLTPTGIEICHRLGTRTLNTNRPIVIRFRFRDTKMELMKIRKSPKGTGLIFAEDLCPEMRELLKELKDHPKVENCWAWNGKLFAKDKNNKVSRIQYGRNWQELFDN